MGVPARLSRMVLAVAAATQVAAAADRFVPSDPAFVVADLRDSRPDEELRGLLADWRVSPGPSTAQALAEAFIARARSAREPRYVGRAESLLATQASRPGAPPSLRRLYARTLQYRHEFAGAIVILDSLLREDRRDADARLARASLRLTRGDFDAARSDCAHLAVLGGAHSTAGVACLAQALAGSGELQRARALLEAAPAPGAADAASRAYLLGTRAELAERAGDLSRAIADYQDALRLEPQDDAIRAALADALVERGDRATARRLLAIEKPGLALLVRSVDLEGGDARHALAGRAREWLELESARGDARHDRELALLEIAAGSAHEALAAAQRNFRVQRELADVRALARAAVLAGDVAVQAELRQWLSRTRYQDLVTDRILAARQSG
jgi:tetratricopeptide (TPR) repeat protein